MPKRRRLSWLDITLLIILLVGVVVPLYFTQVNTRAKEEEARLQTRIKAAELNLSQAQKEANLEELRRTVEQAKSAFAQNPFPDEAVVTGLTDRLFEQAKKNNITIVTMDTSHTLLSLKSGIYPAVRHTLSAEGSLDALMSLADALFHASVVPTVESMDFNQVPQKQNTWRMRLDLTVYYRQR